MSIDRLTCFVLTTALAAGAAAQDTHYSPEGQQIPPPSCLIHHGAWEGSSEPCTPDNYASWLKDIEHWRSERRIRVGLDGPQFEGVPDFYALPELQWTRSEFMQPQMMVQDRYFYDPVQHRYTVDRYLDDLQKRYGGIDAVLIWATYPNMGIDDRNQLDMVRSMPGGLAGVHEAVEEFHRRGVKVLFPMMMWDQGTRNPGQPWPTALAEQLKQIDADGVNGDTQDGAPLVFSLAAIHAGHPLAFQPEDGPSDEGLAWNVLTWGQYEFQFVPTVDRFRWLERRHEVNISDRWNRLKTDDLQYAFFNGEGWESWENIWGIWNGITPRDDEATRRVATLERAVAPFFLSSGWQPFYPMHLYGVFASRWPLADQTVWTLVNRTEVDMAGRQMSVPWRDGMRYFDLYHGVELTPAHEGDQAVLSFAIEAHGYGAVLATAGEPDATLSRLMSTMKQLTAKPLADYSDEWKPLPQELISIPTTEPAASAPPGMARIPGAEYVFRVHGIEIEGGDNAGVDIQFPWEDSPRRWHEHVIKVAPFYIDRHDVTNAEFKNFLDAAHYHPADDLNFLKEWKNGTYPAGWGNKPVTWVSLEDARAYAKWAGKRLPHEWEWQLAAQGTDGRIYPWGNDWDPSRVPVPDQGRTLRGPDDVDAHPSGASLFGVMDMVGNVWQWTDEYLDEHTRAAILRGGSYYQPQGSVWYFPQAWRNDEHGKLLLMAPGYDRSGAVGFRCVQDAR
ncbi:MAG TPA: formylglycine-generating enzyme family protein [Acidobacteriaceae bacterium]|jgi:formylglycine-generating enzyme required for sulfatase activity|nr:formylglycine-generating enzyme family protein [Acidobacteriaceae bacterium]